MDKFLKQGSGFFTVCRGMVVSWLVTAALLLILSVLLLGTGLSTKAAGGIMIAVYILSPFAGGFYLGKKAEQKKYLWGLLFGVLYFVIFCLVSLAINPPGIFSFPLLLKLFLMQAIGGMVGGMLS